MDKPIINVPVFTEGNTFSSDTEEYISTEHPETKVFVVFGPKNYGDVTYTNAWVYVKNDEGKFYIPRWNLTVPEAVKWAYKLPTYDFVVSMVGLVY